MEDSNLYIADQLIQRAKNGVHSEFEFIRSFNEYLAARMFRKATIKVFNSFAESRNNLYKAYIKMVKEGTDSLSVILAISELNQIIKFYEDEIEIVSDMIDEYIAYIHSGHLIDTIVCNYRKEEDLVDFRKIGWFYDK
jgi:hypothetical protein